MALPPVVATLVASTKEFNAKIDESAAKMDGLAASGETAGSKLSGYMNKAASAVIVAGVATAAVSLKMASDFQTAVTQLVTGAGESAKNIDLIKNGLLNLAPVVGQTPLQLAQGLYMIESAGYHGAKGLSVLKAAAEGAKVGNADMSTVASAVTTVLHDYNISASQATSVTSGLVAAVAAGKTHMQDLAGSLGKVLSVTSAIHIPLANVLGSVAALTNSGIPARRATTQLATSITGIIAPSKAAEKMLSDFGLSTQQLLNVMRDPTRGVSAAFQEISDTVGKRFPAGSANYLAAMKAITGSTLGLRTALALTGSTSEVVIQNTKGISQAMANGAQNVQGWAQVQKDLGFQMDKLKATGSSVLIGVGDWLLPKAIDVAKWAQNTIGYLRAHPLVTRIASDAAIATFTAAVGYKLFKGISSVVSTVKGIFGTSATAALAEATGITLPEALAANTAELIANTTALGGTAAAVGVGDVGLLGGAGMLGKTAKLGAGDFVAAAAAGTAAYGLTTAALHTKIGAAVANKVVNFGGNLNPLHDIVGGIAGLTGSNVNPSSSLSSKTAKWADSQAGLGYMYNHDRKRGIKDGISKTTQTRAGHKVTVYVKG